MNTRPKLPRLIAFSVLAYLGLALSGLAFQIDFLKTFVPLHNIPHVGKPIHEEITRDAITNVLPAAHPGFIINLQAGVRNTDVIHMFDAESHFDNSSVLLNRGFAAGFTTINQRIEAARRDAANNPEFLQPHYTSFLEIATDVALTLGEMAVDPECLLKPACPTARAAQDAALVAGFLPALVINPNPDPHRATTPRSLFAFPVDPDCGGSGFGLCGYFGPIQEGYLQILARVESAVHEALGDHFDVTCSCDRNLSEILGSSNRFVVRLQRLRQALRAYHATQNLGHALHATQDFFAHTDYVELMGRVDIGQPIPPGRTIALPANFSQFNLPGLRAIMGQGRFNQLESGDVFTIWLAEGDYSLGDAGILNPFNPAVPLVIGGLDLFGFSLPPVMIPSLGNNPNPFPGFNHGHYLSSTALGLNKDCPFDPAITPTDEPAHRNFPAARQAAVHLSVLLLKSFLQSAGPTNGPVVIQCPANKTVTTQPGQCHAARSVLGKATASGGCSALTITNDAPAQLPRGTNLVRWRATDSCGNVSACTQVIVVRDGEPPQLVCPTNRVLSATTSAGATVTFNMRSVTDNCADVSLSCVPPSGSTFRIGTNVVRCTATDPSANRATCSFTVRVKGAEEQIRDALALLNQFHIPAGVRTSFQAQLREALNKLAVQDTPGACETLRLFLGHVRAQSGKKLTVQQSNSLQAAVGQIRTVLNCR